MAIFSSAYLKLKRARQLIDDVDAILTETAKRGQLSSKLIGPHPSDDGKPDWMTSEVTIARVPPIVAPMIGDVVHNMRTSLDHMASELARLNDESDKSVYFPFANSARGLEEQIKNKNFKRCGADAVKLLRTFKPYTNGNADLRAIHDLDVLDKHRDLVPEPQAMIGDLAAHEWDGPAYLDEQGKLTRNLRFIPVQIKGIRYEFPKSSDLAGRPIIQTLKELVSVCEGILEAFAALKPLDDNNIGDGGDIAADTEREQKLYVDIRYEPPSNPFG